MALSAVEICNRALDDIGSTSITSLADPTLNAKVCARQYPRALEELLANGRWNFALKRMTLVSIPNTRGDGGYAYAVPNDMAMPTQMLRLPLDGYVQAGRIDPNIDIGIQFELAEGVFYSPFDGVQLEYVTNNPNLAVAPPLFARALQALVAAKIVYPITKDAGQKNALLAEAELYRDRGLANELNRSATTYGNFMPEALYAQSWGDGFVY